MRRRLALAVALLAAACGPAPRGPVAPDEDYVRPAAAPGEVSREELRDLEAAWRKVLAGRTAEAETVYRRLLGRHPGLIPAEAGLAYAELRGGRLLRASEDFAAVLNRRPEDFPSLVGAASAASRRGDVDAALDLYRRASAVRAEDPTTRRRLAQVKLQVTEKHVAAGREARAQGDQGAAAEEFRRALDAAPELAGLRVELATALVAQDDLPGAAEVLRADPTGDRLVLLKLGEVLGLRKDYGGALDVYRQVLSANPQDPDAKRRVLEAREALDMSSMPEEFQRIPSAPRITRADLAALLSTRVTALGRLDPRVPEVAVDISGSWARDHILKALSFELLPLYPNHTFQPGATVRRGDLARAVGRILDLLRWPSAPVPDITDMTRNNVYYDGASRAVSAGIMDLTPAGAFEAWRPVSGRDALDVIDGLARLVGP
jgi:tetratricopeptide (TPR) repeat protein